MRSVDDGAGGRRYRRAQRVDAAGHLERVELERRTEEVQHDRPCSGIERLDGDTARRGLDPHLPAFDDAVAAG